MSETTQALVQLARLLEDGLITRQEFDQEKAKILGQSDKGTQPEVRSEQSKFDPPTQELPLREEHDRGGFGPGKKNMLAIGTLVVLGIGGFMAVQSGLLRGERGRSASDDDDDRGRDDDDRARGDDDEPEPSIALPRLRLPPGASVPENTRLVWSLECRDGEGQPGPITLLAPTDLKPEPDALVSDRVHFELRGEELYFSEAPDFERPRDANRDNTYRAGLVCGLEGEPQILDVVVQDVRGDPPCWQPYLDTQVSSSAQSGFSARRRSMLNYDIGVDVDPGVREAMAALPMELFSPPEYWDYLYGNQAVPIGYEESISQPSLQAVILDALALQPTDRVLEIKTASGYQTALMAMRAGEVLTLESEYELVRTRRQIFHKMLLDNIELRQVSSFRSPPSRDGPFDAILVTAAFSSAPLEILGQLAPGGRMVVPVGSATGSQSLVLYKKDQSGRVTVHELLPVLFSMLPGEGG